MLGRLGQYLPLFGIIVAASCCTLLAAYFVGGWDFVGFALAYARRWNVVWMILSALLLYIVAAEIAGTAWFQSFGIEMMQERLQGLVLALVLGSFCLVDPFRNVWTNYWLLRDGCQEMAVVTDDREHGIVGYRYRVSGSVYMGADYRSLHDNRYAKVTPGEATVIYYSVSHPSVSRIDRPLSMLDGAWPAIIIVCWPFEFMAIATIIDPRGRWAFRTGSQNTMPRATSAT